jgi:hypothetical protein
MRDYRAEEVAVAEYVVEMLAWGVAILVAVVVWAEFF